MHIFEEAYKSQPNKINKQEKLEDRRKKWNFKSLLDTIKKYLLREKKELLEQRKINNDDLFYKLAQV